MNKLNVFSYAYRKRYYLTHPLRFIKETGYNLRAAWMRITKGYCYVDCWDLENWLFTVLPPMLRHIADHGSGYPGNDEFDTPEKWSKWLHDTADTLERLSDEDWWDNHNEYSEEFYRLSEENRHCEEDGNGGLRVTWSDSADYNEIRDKWMARSMELKEERQKAIEDVMMDIARHAEMLWD